MEITQQGVKVQGAVNRLESGRISGSVFEPVIFVRNVNHETIADEWTIDSLWGNAGSIAIQFMLASH